MADRVVFSGLQPGLPEIAAHHRDLESSLKHYFSAGSPGYLRFEVGDAATTVTVELRRLLDEVDSTSSLAVLAAVEARFRIDYLQRCYRRDKHPLSRAFRNIHKAKQHRAPLEDEIFEAWVGSSSDLRPLIGELRGAFKLRHWLAHGRYWKPKFGRRYNFDDVSRSPS